MPDGRDPYGGGYLEYVARSGHEAPGLRVGWQFHFGPVRRQQFRQFKRKQLQWRRRSRLWRQQLDRGRDRQRWGFPRVA
jgi:hypothetical protein